jgi:oligoendopeptidase F
MKDTWNLKGLELNEEKTILFVKKKANEILKYKGKTLSVVELKRLLELKQELIIPFRKLMEYYSLKHAKNTQDTNALSKLSKYELLASEISEKTRFFGIWFSKLENFKAAIYLKDPALKEYKYYLESIRKNKQYILDEDKERILSLKNMTSGSVADIYELIVGKYEFNLFNKKLAQEEVTSYYNNKDPKKREKAYQVILSKYKEDSVIHSEIYKNVVLDWYNEDIKIRGYKTPISVRNNANDVSDKAINVLLEVITENAKIFNNYFKLKHKLLNNYEYIRYHIYAPLNIKEKKYSYDDSKKIVLKMFKEFDLRFYEAALKIFNLGHVDSHPAKNKRGGAFSSSPLSKLTPYIMLNHTDNLKDVFTIAHELGHGIHTILASHHNEYNYHANLPLSETASIFSENILANKMLKESKTKNEKISILAEMIDSEYASIVRQGFFTIFEQKAHDMIIKGASKEEIDEAYYSLLKKQFGDMKIPLEFKHEWNYISHIYRSPFYCYAYSFGNLLVLSLLSLYEKEGDKFKEKYIKLLSSGGSENPQKLLKKIGVDIESKDFWMEGFNIIKQRIKLFEKLVKS